MGNDEKVNALVGKKITVKLMPLDGRFYSAATVCGFLVFDLTDVDYVGTTSIVVKY